MSTEEKEVRKASKIEEKIFALKIQQMKIDCLRDIDNLILSWDDKAYEEVNAEIQGLLSAFIKTLVEKVENEESLEPKVETRNETFTEEEVQLLKSIVQRAKATAGNLPKTDKPSNPNTFAEGSDEVPDDQISFAMKYRSKENKDAQFEYNGQTMVGKLVGTDVPNLILQIPAGNRIPIHVNKVRFL